MSLKDTALAVRAERRPAKLCTFGRAREALSAEDRAELDEMLLDEEAWPSLLLSEVLSRHGQPTSDSLIRKHRRGGCCCGPR